MGLDIAVDMDGVVYDFVGTFRAWCLRQGIAAASHPATCWDFYEEWGLTLDDFKEQMAAAVDDGVLWREGQPIKDAVQSLHKVRERGHRIHLVTDRFSGRHAWANTEAWLDTWNVPYDSVHFASDKTIVAYDWLIDDKPGHIDAAIKEGRAGSVFSQPWNQHWNPEPCSGGFRLTEWWAWQSQCASVEGWLGRKAAQ